jgi:hypothetical protein
VGEKLGKLQEQAKGCCNRWEGDRSGGNLKNHMVNSIGNCKLVMQVRR